MKEEVKSAGWEMPSTCACVEGEREGGRKEGRKGGREGGRKGGGVEGREGGREGGREDWATLSTLMCIADISSGGRKEGGREGGREGVIDMPQLPSSPL